MGYYGHFFLDLERLPVLHFWTKFPYNFMLLFLIWAKYRVRARSHLTTTMCFFCHHVWTVTLVTVQPISDDMLTTSKIGVLLSPSANGPLTLYFIVKCMFKTFKTQYQNKLQNMPFCLFHVSCAILHKAVQLSIKKHAVQEI